MHTYLPKALEAESFTAGLSTRLVIRAHRKFNVVLFGVDESHGVQLARLEEDLKKAISVLPDVNESINSHSIKDVYHLGKFSTGNSKPRPLLVKFIRAVGSFQKEDLREVQT